MFEVEREEELRGEGREFRVGKSQSGIDWLRVKQMLTRRVEVAECGVGCTGKEVSPVVSPGNSLLN